MRKLALTIAALLVFSSPSLGQGYCINVVSSLFVSHYSADMHLAAPKFFSYEILANASSLKSSNISHIFLRKFRLYSSSPKNSIGMKNVVGSRDVFEIVETVVYPVPIFMINLMSFWTWADKSSSNQPMSTDGFVAIPIGEMHFRTILILWLRRAKNMSAISARLYAPYVAHIANFVDIFPFNDREPLLHHV